MHSNKFRHQFGGFETKQLTANEPNFLQRSVNSGIRSVVTIGGALMLTHMIFVSGVQAASLESVNTKLSSYSLSPMLYVPPGFAPLVSEYGRGIGNIRQSSPIAVQFVYPEVRFSLSNKRFHLCTANSVISISLQLWVPRYTTTNVNGETGTISANGMDSFQYRQYMYFALVLPFLGNFSQIT